MLEHKHGITESLRTGDLSVHMASPAGQTSGSSIACLEFGGVNSHSLIRTGICIGLVLRDLLVPWGRKIGFF